MRSLANGREVLDCFCYTGGFSINALAGGAASCVGESTHLPTRCRLRHENLALNGLPDENYTQIHGDVFQVLRSLRDQRRTFDMVILDPPKFAPTAAQAQKAARGYKDINLFAFKLLRPGGLLVTFSCSGGVDAALIPKDRSRSCIGCRSSSMPSLNSFTRHQIIQLDLNFPEGAYLKGLICQVSCSDNKTKTSGTISMSRISEVFDYQWRCRESNPSPKDSTLEYLRA